MNKIGIIGIIVIFSLGLIVTPALAVEKYINVKTLSADVYYNVSGEDMKIPVGNSLNFDNKLKVRTSTTGGALVNYYKEAKIILKEKTLAKLYMNSIFIKKGNTWMKFVKRHSSFKIKTPSAVLGIRGTEFGLKVDELGNTTIKLVEGEISVKTDKEERVLLAGSTLKVNNSSRHIEIMRNDSKENKKIKKEDEFKSLKLEKDEEEEGTTLKERFQGVNGGKAGIKKIDGLNNIFGK